MEATIFLIRHGEAEGNHYRRIHGRYDSMLTPDGERQLSYLAARFAETQLDAVYSSPLRRAYRTALAVSGGRGVVTDPDLQEFHVGVWEDKTWGELSRFDKEADHTFSAAPWLFRAENSESMGDVWTRMWNAIGGIARRHPGETVAVASHGMAIRCFMTRAYGYDIEEMNKLSHGDNTSVSRLRWDGIGMPTVEYYADNTHLPQALSTLGKQSWWRGVPDVNLWFRPAQFPADRERFDEYRRDAWQEIYGTLDRYDGDALLDEARDCTDIDPLSVVFAMHEDTCVGLLTLEPRLESRPVLGHISFFYLTREYRNRRLGPQLLGHAVSFFRRRGCAALTLRVAPGNTRAIHFYEREGFVKTGVNRGIFGSLNLMSKNI